MLDRQNDNLTLLKIYNILSILKCVWLTHATMTLILVICIKCIWLTMTIISIDEMGTFIVLGGEPWHISSSIFVLYVWNWTLWLTMWHLQKKEGSMTDIKSSLHIYHVPHTIILALCPFDLGAVTFTLPLLVNAKLPEWNITSMPKSQMSLKGSDL